MDGSRSPSIAFSEARLTHCRGMVQLSRFVFLDEEWDVQPLPAYGECLLTEQLRALIGGSLDTMTFIHPLWNQIAEKHEDLHRLVDQVIRLKESGDCLGADNAVTRVPDVLATFLWLLDTLDALEPEPR